MLTNYRLTASLILVSAFPCLAPGHAQTESTPPAQPGAKFTGNAPFQPKMTDANLEATAMVGSFFLRMKQARTYRGRMVVTKTISRPGQAPIRKMADWKSVWLREGNGEIKKTVANGTFTVISGEGAAAQKTVDRTVQAEDGRIRRRYDPDKNTYTQEPWKNDDPDMAATLTHMVWPVTLMAFGVGDEFAVDTGETAKTPGQIIVHSANGRTRFGIDAATGNMLFWYMDSADGEVTEIRWLDTKLNGKVSDKDLTWTPPAGARQVPVEGNQREFVF